MRPRTARDSKGEAKHQALEVAFDVDNDVKTDAGHKY
jgi:hypothetical protein